jgi:hypothetical protein
MIVRDLGRLRAKQRQSYAAAAQKIHDRFWNACGAGARVLKEQLTHMGSA